MGVPDRRAKGKVWLLWLVDCGCAKVERMVHDACKWGAQPLVAVYVDRVGVWRCRLYHVK